MRYRVRDGRGAGEVGKEWERGDVEAGQHSKKQIFLRFQKKTGGSHIPSTHHKDLPHRLYRILLACRHQKKKKGSRKDSRGEGWAKCNSYSQRGEHRG